MTPADVRFAALAKLVTIESPVVNARLAEEFSKASAALKAGENHSDMSESLAVLGLLVPRFHMAILPLLDDFVHSEAAISPRESSEGDATPAVDHAQGLVSAPLIVEAIEVAMGMRLVHTAGIVTLLWGLTHSEISDVRKAAEDALEQLATLDLEYFHARPVDGAEPQRILVDRISAVDDAALRLSAPLVRRLLGRLLSPVMNSSSQTTYRTFTFRRGAVTSAGGLDKVRSLAISLAQRLYWVVDTIGFRKSILQTLDGATRRDGPALDDATAEMFERDAIAVLSFLRGLVPTEALPLVQSIEHQVYWNYYHAASDAVKRCALDVRDALNHHAEYQIYKQLIGFEGIFGDWEDLKRSDDAWSDTDGKRRAASNRFVQEIDDSNRVEWRGRILAYAKTKSDDLATFPVFFSFLEAVGSTRSDLALDLLTNHFDGIRDFIIPLMRGLWTSEKAPTLERLVITMLSKGEHLSAITRSLYGVKPPRIALLDEVVRRATEADDRPALIDAMGVAASLHAQDGSGTQAPFMEALRALARHDDVRWAKSIWISRDLAQMAETIEPADKAELAAALVVLPEIDYQAERLLSAVSGDDPEIVLNFLDARLIHDLELTADGRSFKGDEHFEAIPNRLHGLGAALAKQPRLMLEMLRRHFARPDAQVLFSHRAATLVRVVFNELAPPLMEELERYAASAAAGDVAFVISILRTYEGDPGIYPVCKAVIRAVPERSAAWRDLAVAIETTGVVTGEFGMAEALERRLTAVADWKDDASPRVQQFGSWISDALKEQIASERRRAEQGLALRKYRYGDDVDEP